MGPVNKRAIPVRQHSRTRQIPLPKIFTSKSTSPPKIPLTASVPELDVKPELAQSVRLKASDSERDSHVNFDFSSKIGSKVCLGGAKTGTFLFCGKTRFSDGTWCGVSLDEASGKNDGSVNGIRYFTCLPAHGVFVRPCKIEFLQSLDPEKEASVRTLPKVGGAEAVPTQKRPVASAIKRPSGFVISGKIQKLGSTQKKMGLKRRFLLDANLNSTTTVFRKETNPNSTKSPAVGAENDPLQFHKTPAVPVPSKLQRFQARPPIVNVKPTKLARMCNDLPSSLNSTITINPTMTLPCSSSNNGDRLSILSPEQLQKLSVNNDCIGGSHLSKLPDYQQPEASHSLVLDCTFDITNSGKSPVSMSRRSQELFMNLSPSKASSPLQLQGELPNNTSLMDLSFESLHEPSLTSEVKQLQHSNETKTLLASSEEDESPQKICVATSQVTLANQTVVVESHVAKDQLLNRTFQVDDQIPHAESIALSAENTYHDSGASRQTGFKCTINLPLIEENEQAIGEAMNLSISEAEIFPFPIKGTECSLLSTNVNFEKDNQPFFDSRINSTICIATKASGTNSAQTARSVNAAVNLNETFCCITKADVSPNVNKTSVNRPSSFQPDDCLQFTVNCNEHIMERESCLLRDDPVASTPACRFNKGQFFTTLFAPILKSKNWISNPKTLTPQQNQSLTQPSEMRAPDAFQISASSDQSLGILSQSQMQDFTVDGSTCSYLEADSPVTPSFCNRMFPIDTDYKTKGRFSSILQLGSSPDCASSQAVTPSANKHDTCQLNDSLLDLGACAAIELPDDSILDISACAAIRLPDDSLLDMNSGDTSRFVDGFI